MELQYLFENASRLTTVISFATFAGILVWTYVRTEKDFAQAASLPFADDDLEEDYV